MFFSDLLTCCLVDMRRVCWGANGRTSTKEEEKKKEKELSFLTLLCGILANSEPYSSKKNKHSPQRSLSPPYVRLRVNTVFPRIVRILLVPTLLPCMVFANDDGDGCGGDLTDLCNDHRDERLRGQIVPEGR